MLILRSINLTLFGFSMSICTTKVDNTQVGVFIAQGPPVPIPNTEVKLCGAEDTCLATSREDRSVPTFFQLLLRAKKRKDKREEIKEKVEI